ncbi:hypothetical protein ACFX13_023175 [Malus domestica]
MDRDREANTRCTWFIQIGYVHRVEEFSLIVKGLHNFGIGQVWYKQCSPKFPSEGSSSVGDLQDPSY